MPGKATYSRKINTKDFHERCQAYEDRFNTSPEETLFRLLRHKDPDIQLRAANSLLQKKVPTPRQIDVGDLMQGGVRGRIIIDIGGGVNPQIIGQQEEPSAQLEPQRKLVALKKVPSVNMSSRYTVEPGLLPTVRKPASIKDLGG